jgi:hypothetical protein
MLYLREFPDFASEQILAIPAAFEDVSWHNDACPSFHCEAMALTIWIDYASPSNREFPDSPRFALVDSADPDSPVDVYAGDDWQSLIAAFDTFAAALASGDIA